MENRKGNGIFLGIVSVATLIVAIIGATFAFFSATTQSDPNAVNLEAYQYSLSMSVSPVWDFASGIIPMDPDGEVKDEKTGLQIDGPNNTNLLYAVNTPGVECVDNVNNLQVCALYAVTIKNTAANPVDLAGQIKTTANNPGSAEGATGFVNLTYQEIESGTPEAGNLVFGEKTVTLAKEVATGEGTVGIVDIGSISVPGGTTEVPGEATTYVLIYLNDDGSDQSLEMGSSYEGQFIYSSKGEGGSTLTGAFRVSGSTD